MKSQSHKPIVRYQLFDNRVEVFGFGRNTVDLSNSNEYHLTENSNPALELIEQPDGACGIITTDAPTLVLFDPNSGRLVVGVASMKALKGDLVEQAINDLFQLSGTYIRDLRAFIACGIGKDGIVQMEDESDPQSLIERARDAECPRTLLECQLREVGVNDVRHDDVDTYHDKSADGRHLWGSKQRHLIAGDELTRNLVVVINRG